MRQATACAAAERRNKGTFGAELGPKTCPVSHVLALTVRHLGTTNQKEGCRREQPRLTRSNKVRRRPQGLSEMKANLAPTLKCQSHDRSSTSAFPFTARLKAFRDVFSSKCCYFTLTRRSLVTYYIPLPKNSMQTTLNNSIFWDLSV